MKKVSLQQRIKEAFEDTVETNNLRYDGTMLDIDYFGLFCKATSKDRLFKFLGANVCMFNCLHEDDESVLVIFSIPINSDSSTKNIADRVMEITETMERCFTTLDFIQAKEKKNDKFVYVTVIKKLTSREED